LLQEVSKLCEKTNEKKKERPINFPYICIKVFFRFTLCLPKNYARLPISETKKIEKFKVFLCVHFCSIRIRDPVPVPEPAPVPVPVHTVQRFVAWNHF